jgi:hypothetical protein
VDLFSGVDRHNMRAIENEHTRARKEVARLFDALLTRDGVLHVEKLSDPSPEKTREIVLETLGVDNVPPELVFELCRCAAPRSAPPDPLTLAAENPTATLCT